MLPLSYLRMPKSDLHISKGEIAHQQSLHGLMDLPRSMAGGWRGLLREESEHQWLAIAVFFLFILVGAFALEGTQHFVGDTLKPLDAQHNGGLVLDVEYHEGNSSYTALVYSPGAGYHFFTEHVDDGTTSVIYTPESNDLGRDVNFVKSMPDGEIVFSVSDNQLIGLQSNLMVSYEYSTNNGVFGILDVAEQTTDGVTQRLLLTQEGQNKSFRGVSSLIPTPAMSMTAGIQWHSVEAHSAGMWLAIGSHSTTAGGDGSSPASPQTRAALGWIDWDGTETTPVLSRLDVVTYPGQFHTISTLPTGLVVGGTETSLHVGMDQEIVDLETPCSISVTDNEGTVWFIGERGTDTIATWDGENLEVHLLSRDVPLDTTAIGTSGDNIHVHGTNADGTPIVWSIDITANGSIESGRGFLSLLFVIGGGVLLAVMGKYAFEQRKALE